MVSLRIPIATYRLQLNREFRFEDAQAIVLYLHRLGITNLYTSPIFKARQGSSHGYDVTDPTCINPELGMEQAFESLVQELNAYGMGLLLDIIPNHMAATPENPWWTDVLENGQSSLYAKFFDIDWNPSSRSLKDKVLLPVLGTPYRQALENRELVLTLDNTGLFIDYHGFRLPLNIKSCATVISYRFDKLEAALGATSPVFQKLKQMINTIECLPSCVRGSWKEAQKIHEKQQQIKDDFWHLVNTSPEIKSFLSENIALFNGDKLNPSSFDLLDGLLSQQSYQLAFWKTALNDINYRRFFDINDLVGVRVEEGQVFEATHALILRLVRRGKVTGLRIDHIDGLHDPLKYLRRLQHQLARRTEDSARQPDFYIVVEKILSGDETLPEEWPVSGTTGYEFLNIMHSLFVDEKGFQQVKSIYSRFTGLGAAFEDVVYQKKKQVMKELFASEIHSLGQQLTNLSWQDWAVFHFSDEELKKILVEVIACLPVYRTYTNTLEVSPRDRLHLEHTIKKVQQQNPVLNTTALEFVKRLLLLAFPVRFNSKRKMEWLRFVMRWQQFTGAVMAKGLEDTTLYNYNCLLSLNEVGGNPGEAISPVETFHQHNLSMQKNWSYTLNTTATHDTKRGEDVRTRINVLSEMPQAWERHLTRWGRWNQGKKPNINGQPVPDPNMEMFLYQTLVGAWPFSDEEVPQFKERVKAYMLKAAREAKALTSWISPNSDYEGALLDFIDIILEDSGQNAFLENLLEFQRKVAYYGALNSLSQVLLKVASPGVPDFYQGTELWDFNLVDPDNRRPVDFEKRARLLDDLTDHKAQGQTTLINKLLSSWEDGRVKQYVTHKVLSIRRSNSEMFVEGDYIPLEVEGTRNEHVCAFTRRKGNNWALIAAPRLPSKLVRVGTLPLGRRVWRDDILYLPDDAPQRWLNIFTGETIRVSSAIKGALLANIFRRFPIALLVASSTK